MPRQPAPRPTAVLFKPLATARRDRNPDAERLLAEQLVIHISQHRQAGRAALVLGDLETACDELWAARTLEPDLDRLGATARECMPRDWEIETDLTPLARALSSRHHPRAADAWRSVLDDRPARSVQAEAAEWLAGYALASGDRRAAIRLRHAASRLGRTGTPESFRRTYRQAGLDPVAAFNLYLTASRVDARTARAVDLKDPLTDLAWSDQDGRWWAGPGSRSVRPLADAPDHQTEALARARDLAADRRAQGWLLLAEGDHAAGPLGARSLGRTVRAGCLDPADEDTFVRIRMAYEGAAERLPDVAWPWYRLAELMAWAGFADRAVEHLAQAERRSVGGRAADGWQRPLLRGLVQTGLGCGPDGLPTTARPFPAEPFGASVGWRFRFR